MSNHFSGPNFEPPNGDARLDITDLYAFQKPGEPSKSILIMNVNPFAPTMADSFDPQTLYEIKIDTNGDAVADIAFRFSFSPIEADGTQSATVRMATGQQAAGTGRGGTIIFQDAPVCLSVDRPAQVVTAGDFKFFVGIRSDPFFVDLNGYMNNMQFTGDDFFIDKNVFSMALEVPNSALGANPKIGMWARALIPGPNGDTLVPADRAGRPSINNLFNQGDEKNTFNQSEPTQDRAHFLDKFVAVLTAAGYTRDEATGIAQVLLPDILPYDYSSPAGFPEGNGRKLTDDVIDQGLALMTKGKVTTDKVGPHTDLLPSFPYLGNPHH